MKIDINKKDLQNILDKLESVGGNKGKTKFKNAFNRAGFTTRKKIMEQMPATFKKVNSFTINSVLFEQLKINNGQMIGGEIKFRKKSSGVGAGIYLMPEEFGGKRNQNGLEYQLFIRNLIKRDQYLVPTSAKPSNIPRPNWIVSVANSLAKGTVTSIGKRKGKFIKAKSRNTEMFLLTEQHGKLAPGLYVRLGKGRAVPYFILVNRTNYKAIFNFYNNIRKFFSDSFREKLNDELSK